MFWLIWINWRLLRLLRLLRYVKSKWLSTVRRAANSQNRVYARIVRTRECSFFDDCHPNGLQPPFLTLVAVFPPFAQSLSHSLSQLPDRVRDCTRPPPPPRSRPRTRLGAPSAAGHAHQHQNEVNNLLILLAHAARNAERASPSRSEQSHFGLAIAGSHRSFDSHYE